MKFKIIFGIIIPLLTIIVLVTLGSLNIGFSVKKDFVTKLTLKDIFEESQLRNSIKIADITLENDYFLGKRYELPRLGICLDDKEGNLQRINAGNLQYSEGDYDYERGDFVYQTSYKSYPYYYGGYNEARNIQIKANEKKSIRVFLQPSYEFGYKNYTQLLEQYGEYDALLIFEIGNKYTSYYDCSNIDQETLDKATAIPIGK